VQTIVPLAVAVPLLAAAAMTALNAVMPRVLGELCAIAAAAATVVLCAILLARSTDGTIVYWFGAWHPAHGVALGISFSIDPLGAGMALLAATLMTATLVYSTGYFASIGGLYPALMLGFLAGMVGLSLSGDLFNMFVFFELMGAAAYALTAYKIEEAAPLQGAINFAVTNSVGAYAMLLGIGLVYARTGALNLAQLGNALAAHHSDMLVVIALLLIMLGFLVKAAVVPLHMWLADAHAVAPFPVCVLFSGVMVELGLYAFARIYWTVFSGPLGAHADSLRAILVALGVATMLVGGVMCFAQRHIKRLLAFSTISHVGMFLAAIALLSGKAIAGLAMYILSHGMTKGGLFMAAGVFLQRLGSVDQYALRGRGRVIWYVAPLFVLGGLLLATAPMFGTFFGKSLIDGSAHELDMKWLSPFFLIASALTGAAVLRVTGMVFGGWGPPEPAVDTEPGRLQEKEAEEEEPESAERGARALIPMSIPPLLLLVGAVVIGLIPGVVHGIEHAGAGFVDRHSYAQAVLHGAHVAPPHVKPSKLTTFDFIYAGLSTAGAIALAAWALFAWRLADRVPRALLRPGAVALRGLRTLHSGHVGDYVVWITVWLGAVGGAFAVALR
jgi:multicomponent Na+:H+ antiporter subunit D